MNNGDIINPDYDVEKSILTALMPCSLQLLSVRLSLWGLVILWDKRI